MDSEMPDNTECDKCNSDRLIEVYVEGRDGHNVNYKELSHEGYMNEGLGLSGNYGDAIQFKLCLDCGKLQGKFPIFEESVKEFFKEDE